MLHLYLFKFLLFWYLIFLFCDLILSLVEECNGYHNLDLNLQFCSSSVFLTSVVALIFTFLACFCRFLHILSLSAQTLQHELGSCADRSQETLAARVGWAHESVVHDIRGAARVPVTWQGGSSVMSLRLCTRVLTHRCNMKLSLKETVVVEY